VFLTVNRIKEVGGGEYHLPELPSFTRQAIVREVWHTFQAAQSKAPKIGRAHV
jgi:hypothetical protein